MRDLATVMWKEVGEFLGNRTSLRTFALAVAIMGFVPYLVASHGRAHGLTSPIGEILGAMYVLIAVFITVANTATDLVLHERIGRTFDYLLSTRLPDAAIFWGKVLTSTVVGYTAALLAVAAQLLLNAALARQGFSWLYLGSDAGRIVVLGASAALAVYLSVVGTFVALRVGDQRSSYLLTVLSVAVIAVPFVAGWLHPVVTAAWLGPATVVLGAVAIALGLIGTFLFRREMLVLYLQE